MNRNNKPRLFYGHIIVAASFAIQWICVGTMFTYGIFFKHLANEFGWSRATISGASSLAFVFGGLIGIIAGRLNDRFGPKIIIAVSGISLGLGYLLMSQLQAPWHLYLFYGIIVGIGFSGHDVVTLSTIARWFVRRRGLMTGITKVGTGAGQLIMPLIASMLIAGFGWRTSYVIIGWAVIILYIILSQFMRRDPQQMGLLPDGETDASIWASESTEQGLSLGEAIRTRQFWTICLAYFTVIYCLLTVIIHIVPHATDMGIAETKAAGILSVIGAVSMAGRMVIGTASDKIGGKRTMTICFFILTACTLWLQIASEMWMLYLFAVVYGFAHGGFYTLISPLIAHQFGTKAHGVIFSIVYFAGTVGGAIGPLLAGYIFDINQSYQPAFWILTGLSLTGLSVISTLKPLAIKRSG
ncbi:MFS transporter [Bacteroidota bacterium]